MRGNRSRLWVNPSEIYNILSENQATQAVEILDIQQMESSQKFDIDGKAFAQMKNLRILKLPKDDAVNFSGRLEFLSNKLILLYWHGCPFELLPSDFYPENIVVIDLSYSNIKQLWTRPKCLRRLKVMKLGDCRRARSFPSKVEMDALQVLNLSGCLNVNQVPQAFWSRWWTSIRGFIWNQQHPQRSVSLEGLHMLKSLNLSFCNLEQVPDGLGGLSCLSELRLEGNNFTSLPGSLSQLSHLQKLRVDGCKKLEALPELSHTLQYLHARDCTSLCSITGSNPIMSKRTTYLSNCPKLFKNQVSISDTECLDSNLTSQGSTNRFSSFLGYARIQNNRRGFFSMPGSSIKNMDLIYHGNSIPNWFTYKSMGNHVKVELPLDWSFSKLRGYGICVVFKRKEPFTRLGYSVKNFDGAYLGSCTPYYDAEYFKDIEVKECGARIVYEDLDEEGDLSMFEELPTLSQHGGALCHRLVM
ncbi:NB-ARC domains-containing protein, partial [Tanacetum coccineum]